MEKNPFSLFDFLGYFIPGAFFMFLCFFLQQQGGILYYLKVKNIQEFNDNVSIIYATFFVIFSYILGHILSFLSTLTIENFTVWMFGFPSKNLLKFEKEKKYFVEKDNCCLTILSYILRLLLFLFLLPISFFSITIGKLFDLNRSVYTKSLDDIYIKLIKSRVYHIFKKMGKKGEVSLEKFDFHKLLIYYSYNTNISHQPKLMNYVALYGFLRVCCLIFNILSLYFLVLIFIDSEEKTISDCIICLVSSILAYITYLGYLKFYRRYSQENLMILLLEDKKQ
ncbi:hypothetical protein [Myroides marinus]|nr:hypothetical protein [Myroides marinus]MDM1353274.1 hypothetical protein [Myroides marinus]